MNSQTVRDELLQRALWLEFHWKNDDITIQDVAVEHNWWRYLVENHKRDMRIIGHFLLDVIDDLLEVVAKLVGPRDIVFFQTTLLEVISGLYDTMVEKLKVPWWVKPFANNIHRIVKSVVLPLILNYLVHKFVAGKMIV
jgi:hypothetical protein